MTDATATPGASRQRITVLDVLRLLSEIVALAAITAWGILAWPVPWNIATGIAAPLLVIVLWTLFVSPKAVIRVPSAIRIVVELLIFASATASLWALGFAWEGIAVGVFCVAVGLAVGMRSLR
ncbi:YrdB family protein [Microbacterium amylolyticum]|uniref:4-amino-4-deoxy-L-arabinose transferase n=1 Tax=Microbacterium amylolyticum TaxID=936337 RepID=A0ABS4ZKB1_9MICO|nr:YrdB family protein [Microbacterium amylolyticum]MBP2437438.1 hypothetical protein [Microbacterium amylolyticum]